MYTNTLMKPLQHWLRHRKTTFQNISHFLTAFKWYLSSCLIMKCTTNTTHKYLSIISNWHYSSILVGTPADVCDSAVMANKFSQTIGQKHISFILFSPACHENSLSNIWLLLLIPDTEFMQLLILFPFSLKMYFVAWFRPSTTLSSWMIIISIEHVHYKCYKVYLDQTICSVGWSLKHNECSLNII